VTSSTRQSLWGHITVYLILAGTFYALVIYPFELSELVKGAFIGFTGTAIAWEFGTAVANNTARQQSSATTTALTANPNTPTPPSDQIIEEPKP
jgi:hypothetical protein